MIFSEQLLGQLEWVAAGLGVVNIALLAAGSIQRAIFASNQHPYIAKPAGEHIHPEAGRDAELAQTAVAKAPVLWDHQVALGAVALRSSWRL